MKTLTFTDREEWLDARRGRITGSTAKDVSKGRGTKMKVGVYRLIADRVAIPRGDENRMDRGQTLEGEAIERFTQETGKQIDTSLVIWARDDNENIAISPDGFSGETEAFAVISTGTREAVEVKCLDSARHVEAYITKAIPEDYKEQAQQYFVVNDKLETLYFIFYDPSMPMDFFYLTMSREDVAEEVGQILEAQKQTLTFVEEWVGRLTF
jgi:hypothetical protein